MFNDSSTMDNIFDFKAGLTWIVSAVMVLFSKIGGGDTVPLPDIVINIMTIVSLVVAIGYTITRWYFLLKDRKKKKK